MKEAKDVVKRKIVGKVEQTNARIVYSTVETKKNVSMHPTRYVKVFCYSLSCNLKKGHKGCPAVCFSEPSWMAVKIRLCIFPIVRR